MLVKSIAHAPFDADFSLSIALLGDRMSTLLSGDDQLTAFETATQLSLLLRERDFPKFWSTLNSSEVQQGPLYPAITSLPSFSNLVRKSIARSIANTFRSLQKQRAQQWLGFSGESAGDLETFARESMGWTIEGDSVRIPSNEANDPKSTVQSETVDLSRESNLSTHRSLRHSLYNMADCLFIINRPRPNSCSISASLECIRDFRCIFAISDLNATMLALLLQLSDHSIQTQKSVFQ